MKRLIQNQFYNLPVCDINIIKINLFSENLNNSPGHKGLSKTRSDILTFKIVKQLVFIYL